MPSAPEPLAPHHDLDGFCCGEPQLDIWLKRRAKANQISGATRTFVVRESGAVIAYYALASSAVTLDVAPGRFRRNMPDPIPVVILARLAVAESHQRQGIARGLFQDAARRVLNAADSIGIRGLLVHALSADAAVFYRHLGFESSPLDPMTLMVTVRDLRQSLL